MTPIQIKLVFLLLFNSFIIFSQKESASEKKISAYINICRNVDDIKKIECFKNNYPNIFKYYPDINPINPSNKPNIGSKFSSKRLHPIEGKIKAHNGIDIVAKKNTPVYATASGTAKTKFFNGKAGNSVEITHKFGFTTKYFHLSIFIVKTGDSVRKGQIIGFLGTTGGSTGPHLHYEILKNGKYINPIHFLNQKKLTKGKKSGE